MAEVNRNNINNAQIQEEMMTKIDALLLIIFSIFLPTLDIYTDIGLSFMVSDIELNFVVSDIWLSFVVSYRTIGLVILAPVILSFLFLIPQWLKIEDTIQKRLKTLPLLFLQIWPQYRVVKILYYGYKRNPEYANKKAIYDKYLSSIGEKNI